jgi:arylsulfatase A-like enzyme
MHSRPVHRLRSQMLAVLSAGCALTATGVGQAQVAADPPDRPNILWITSEDNGPHLGCYGDTYATTPNLDALAAQGLRYTHAWSNAPVSAPARTTLITGMYATSLGAQHMRSRAVLPKFVRPFTAYLREAGYYCSNNSKQDYNFATPEGTWDDSSRQAHWRQRSEDQPFFAVFNFTGTHESRVWPRGDGATVHDPDDAPVPPYHPDVLAVRRDWAQYYDNLTALDERVGRILAELEADGLADDTIVFYFSDHGPGLPRSKRWLYQSGLHVPLIMHFPEKYQHLAPREPGEPCDRLVGFVDFGPTVLSLAGIEPPSHTQGRAFLGSHEAPPKEYLFGFRDRMDARHDFSRCIFDGRFKYIRNYLPHLPQGQYLEYQFRSPTMQAWQAAYDAGTLNEVQAAFFERKPAEELYDVLADPHEISNLVGVEEYEEDLSRLRDRLFVGQEWMHDTGFVPESMLRRWRGDLSELSACRSLSRYDVQSAQLMAEFAARGDQPSAKVLLDALQMGSGCGDPLACYWVIMACFQQESLTPELAAQLEQLLDSDEPAVAIAAAELLAGHGIAATEALATLAEYLEHEQGEVRLAAADALDRLDHAALPALAAITKADRAAGDGKVPIDGYLKRIFRKTLTDLAAAPPEATVLFDGRNLAHWEREGGGEIGWTIVDGELLITPGSGSIITREPVADFHFHVEFNLPDLPDDVTGQGRGNSGVYIQQRYEVQILDSFGLEPSKQDCGAIYKTKVPDVNACRKPGEWQEYHIRFRQPRWRQVDGEWRKIEDARLTVVQNGLLIHDDVAVPNKTGAGMPEGPEARPLRLQDHGNPVRFRNIWIAPLEND